MKYTVEQLDAMPVGTQLACDPPGGTAPADNDPAWWRWTKQTDGSWLDGCAHESWGGSTANPEWLTTLGFTLHGDPTPPADMGVTVPTAGSGEGATDEV